MGTDKDRNVRTIHLICIILMIVESIVSVVAIRSICKQKKTLDELNEVNEKSVQYENILKEREHKNDKLVVWESAENTEYITYTDIVRSICEYISGNSNTIVTYGIKITDETLCKVDIIRQAEEQARIKSMTNEEKLNNIFNISGIKNTGDIVECRNIECKYYIGNRYIITQKVDKCIYTFVICLDKSGGISDVKIYE